MSDANSGVICLRLKNVSELTENETNELPLVPNYFEITVGKNRTEGEESLGVTVNCNRLVFSNVWTCNASIRVSLVGSGDDEKSNSFSQEFQKVFTRLDDEISIPTFKKWTELMDPKNLFVVDNTVIVEVFIKVNSCTGWNKYRLETFETPDQLTDAILLVEDKKCHVSKHILACHSPYFKALFYGDFKEKMEEEIKIVGVDYSEFVDLLNCIYPTDFSIHAENVSHLLKLADRFEVFSVIRRAEKFLIYNENIHPVDKLKYAEQYKLGRLQDKCLWSLEVPVMILYWQNHEHYKELGDITLSLLFQKLTELAKKGRKIF